MKPFKVLIEIESETDGRRIFAIHTAEFPTLEEAEQFAERLNATGEQLAKEYDND